MDIIQTPNQNQVFLNTAPINIIIESIRGAGYYFKINILENGNQYDNQPRSKITDHRCEIDFSGLVANIFNQPYVPPAETAVVHQKQLLKKIQITVTEYNEITDAQVDQLELPPFYLLNAQQENNLVFNQLQSLSIYNHHIKTTSNGVLSVPFFAIKTTTASLFINGVIQHTQVVNNALGVYNYNIVLEPFNVTEDSQVMVVFTDADRRVEIPVVVYQILVYNSNLLVFKNNYNAWEHFYCFGERKTNKQYVRKTIKVDEKRTFNYKTISYKDYSVNTGDYHIDYTQTVEDLLDSVAIYLMVTNELIEVSITNKKSVAVKSKAFHYKTYIDFKNNHKPDLKNGIQYMHPDTLVNITVTGYENQLIEVTKQQILDAFRGLAPETLRFPIINHIDTVNVHQTTGVAALTNATAYAFNQFEKLSITPVHYGNPYTTISFNLENEKGISNTAKIIFNVIAHDPNNKPPVISLPSEIDVFVDDVSKTITATVTDPDGDDFTLLWLQENGKRLTLNSTTTASVQISNWKGAGTRALKLIATDARGNSSEKIVNINIVSNLVATIDRLNVRITGGIPGEKLAFNFSNIDYEYNPGVFIFEKDKIGEKTYTPRPQDWKPAWLYENTYYYYLNHLGEREFKFTRETNYTKAPETLEEEAWFYIDVSVKSELNGLTRTFRLKYDRP